MGVVVVEGVARSIELHPVLTTSAMPAKPPAKRTRCAFTFHSSLSKDLDVDRSRPLRKRYAEESVTNVRHN
jgi:hypothetical protein